MEAERSVLSTAPLRAREQGREDRERREGGREGGGRGMMFLMHSVTIFWIERIVLFYFLYFASILCVSTRFY